MKRTPVAARIYLLLAAFLLVLPTLSSMYGGYTGKLLIAGDRVKDGPFHQSVVYLVRHDLFGAHGFIINKPLDGSYENAPTLKEIYGGPVSYPGRRKIVAFRESGLASQRELTSEDVREVMGEQFLIRGYAGWGPLQLNYESLRGVWKVIDFDYSLVTETEPGEIWDKAVAKHRLIHPPKPEKGT